MLMGDEFHVKVLFFARSKELTGVPEATISLSRGASTVSFLAALYQQVSKGLNLFSGPT